MSSRRSNTRAGYTMVEVMISMAVTGIMMSFLFLIQSSGGKVASQATHDDETQSRLTRAMERIATELRTVVDASIWEDLSGLSNDTDVLTFQQAISLDIGGVTQGPVVRVAFEPEPGELRDDLDNDGDGLVDEGLVVLTRDPGGPAEMKTVLCRNVREYFEGELLDLQDDNENGLVDEPGFHIQRVGDQLLLRLSVEDRSRAGATVIHSGEARIRIRN